MAETTMVSSIFSNIFGKHLQKKYNQAWQAITYLNKYYLGNNPSCVINNFGGIHIKNRYALIFK